MMISKRAAVLTILIVALSFSASSPVSAVVNPQSSSTGLEGTVQGAPPTQAASIGIPANGQVFGSTPITVSGLCKTGLLIKVFSNNVFVGSAVCTAGSYSLKVDLFSGRNDLVSRVFDNLDQQGPDSNVVTVTFNDAQFIKFGTRVSLTSSYARLGADPGSVLTWPFILSGGTGPYAVSIDWGDNTGTSLKSVSFPGVFNATHIYNQAGVYSVVAKVTDANGTSAYLQAVGVANGKISGSIAAGAHNGQNPAAKTTIVWQPLLAIVPFMLLAFWLGRRYELFEIRRSIESGRQDA